MRYITLLMSYSFEVAGEPTTCDILSQLRNPESEQQAPLAFTMEPTIIPVKRYEDGNIRAIPRLLHLYPGLRDARGQLLATDDHWHTYDATA